MSDQAEVLYVPAEVGRRLGVKGSTLRNYAKAYETVYGELHRGSRGERLWPAEALERLDAARQLLRGGQAVSLEAALALLARGDAEVSSVLAEPTPEPMMLVLEELRALRQEVQDLKAQLQALPPPAEPRRPWWQVWRKRDA